MCGIRARTPAGPPRQGQGSRSGPSRCPQNPVAPWHWPLRPCPSGQHTSPFKAKISCEKPEGKHFPGVHGAFFLPVSQINHKQLFKTEQKKGEVRELTPRQATPSLPPPVGVAGGVGEGRRGPRAELWGQHRGQERTLASPAGLRTRESGLLGLGQRPTTRPSWVAGSRAGEGSCARGLQCVADSATCV